MLRKISKAVLLTTCLVSGAQATPITYLGADDSVSSLSDMVNSVAAMNDFLSVAGALDVVDFESAIPPDVTISGGSVVSSNCGALCGFNTTAGGSFWTEVFGGSVTFTFSDPVDAFGFFVSGLQTDLVPLQTITYTDGSNAQQFIDMPSSTGGGGAFVGFIDYGELISSVTFDATNDILAFDDLLFGQSASNPGNPTPPTSVPAPATFLLLLASLIGFRKYSKNIFKS
ncbi:hypothetical protein BFC17_08590 [Alteromonas lipolytica]|uniref:PEP-CTERM sorting domain-containing protein n=2 Tax=Alteromonas lipolytica TaxID=1856405 RepID=A0A1E8FK25_9ALTE|nr:hypothetical protein BFC17_08590 [Alteromonas lipolytica]